MSDTPENHPDDGQKPENNRMDYTVGRGKPPKHAQWQKGRSGNPSGKRKPRPSYGHLLDQILSELISGTENGRTVRMTRRQALVKSLVNGAVAGDPVAEQILLMLEKPEASAPRPRLEWRLVDSEDDIPPQ